MLIELINLSLEQQFASLNWYDDDDCRTEKSQQRVQSQTVSKCVFSKIGIQLQFVEEFGFDTRWRKYAPGGFHNESNRTCRFDTRQRHPTGKKGHVQNGSKRWRMEQERWYSWNILTNFCRHDICSHTSLFREWLHHPSRTIFFSISYDCMYALHMLHPPTCPPRSSQENYENSRYQFPVLEIK